MNDVNDATLDWPISGGDLPSKNADALVLLIAILQLCLFEPWISGVGMDPGLRQMICGSKTYEALWNEELVHPKSISMLAWLDCGDTGGKLTCPTSIDSMSLA